MVFSSNMTKLHPQDNKCIGSAAQATEISKYIELFGETPVFHSIIPRTKAGFGGWNNPDRLKTAREMGFLLGRKRNIAIRLGIDTERGYTVVFDKESYGEIPDNLLQSFSELALVSWQSQSGGQNNLLTLTKEAYEYLDQFKTQVTFGGDKHDLELLTSGYALVPPSKIDDNHQYDDLETNPQAPTVEIDSIREILNDIPIEKKSEGSGSGKSLTNKSGVKINRIPDGFDIDSHFRDNVVYFGGNFDDEKSHYHQFMSEVLGQDRISERVFTEPDDQSMNEKLLAIDLAWYLQNDTKSIQYFFEQVLPGFRNNKLKFKRNKTHRNDCLDLDEYVSRPYWVQGLSFSFRHQLADRLLENETLTRNQLYEDMVLNIEEDLQSYSKKQIDRGLKLFVEFGLIEETDDNKYRNKSIKTEYVEELDKICDKDEYKPVKYPCED